AEKLKQRYRMRIEHPAGASNQQIWLLAQPRFQEQAANYREVIVIFNSQRMLPEAMQVTLPNGERHVYKFKLAEAKVNGPLNWLNGLFAKPTVPWGWQLVVDDKTLAQAPTPLDQKQR